MTSTRSFGARRMPQYAGRAGVREHGSGNRQAQRQLALRDVVRAGVGRQDAGQHSVQLPGLDAAADGSSGEAEPLELVIGDEVEAPLGDAHDVRINRAHARHRTERGVTPTAWMAGFRELFA